MGSDVQVDRFHRNEALYSVADPPFLDGGGGAVWKGGAPPDPPLVFSSFLSTNTSIDLDLYLQLSTLYINHPVGLSYLYFLYRPQPLK